MAAAEGAEGLAEPFTNVYDWLLDVVGAFP